MKSQKININKSNTLYFYNSLTTCIYILCQTPSHSWGKTHTNTHLLLFLSCLSTSSYNCNSHTVCLSITSFWLQRFIFLLFSFFFFYNLSYIILIKMASGSGYQEWESDPLFSAAEVVQDSADRYPQPLILHLYSYLCVYCACFYMYMFMKYWHWN